MARKHNKTGAVAVHGDGVRVRRVHKGNVETAEVRSRFGGLDLPASLAGMLAALGLAVILAGLLTGAGTVGYQAGLRGDADDLSGSGLIVGLVILLLAFLVGGWVAGRIARYDGARNGLMTAVWFLLLVAVVAALGAWLGDKYDFLADINLPQWFSGDARTSTAVLSGAIAVLVTLGAGLLGGKLGERYHKRADELLLHSRPGGISPAPPIAGPSATARIAPVPDGRPARDEAAAPAQRGPA